MTRLIKRLANGRPIGFLLSNIVRDPRKPIMIGRITTVKTGPVVYYRITTNDYLNYANLWTDLGSISETR